MSEPSSPSYPKPKLLEEAVCDEWKRLENSKALHLGYPSLDKIAKPSTNQLMILGGRPGTYKTAIMLTWVLNLARSGKFVLLAPLEMGEGTTATCFLSRLSGVSRNDLADTLIYRKPLPPEKDEARTRAFRDLSTLNSRITLHPSASNTLSDIIDRACRSRYDAIFVDHLGIIGGPGSELDRISAAIDRFRLLAHGQLVPGYHPFVCLLSPLSREIERGGDKIRYPRMSDLRGSGNIESHADVVAITHRAALFSTDEQDKSLRLIVLKNRNGPSPAAVELDPHPATAWVDEAQPKAGEQIPIRHFSESEEP